jgi:hypothetical protein
MGHRDLSWEGLRGSSLQIVKFSYLPVLDPHNGLENIRTIPKTPNNTNCQRSRDSSSTSIDKITKLPGN